MSLFDWNIDVWGINEVPNEVRKKPLTLWVLTLLAPVKYLFQLFVPYRIAMLKKVRYNSQVIVLENLLNDMFDNTLRRIRVITTYDRTPNTYVYNDAENKDLILYNAAELDADPTLDTIYLYNTPELGVLYDFIVECAAGSLTANQETRLKAIVNYYRLAGKKPLFQYDDLTTF